MPNRFSGNVSVLLGRAGGDFDPAAGFAAGSEPFAVAVGDMGRRRPADMVTGNRLSDDVSVLLGDGTGAFAPPVSFPAGNSPESIALGERDGDGDFAKDAIGNASAKSFAVRV